jgi:phosphoribosylformimino-5-aminoimidazole carboxamide ribonucleotide (ProFAR) isomerase
MPRYRAGVAFEVIPAIDVSGGRLARMTADGPVEVDAFGGDPVAAAEAFVRAGARWLHVVDIDLAATGNALNINTVMSIRRAALFAGAKVQASGGVSRREDVEFLLDVGAARVVLGSRALSDPALVTDLTAELGEKVAVGIEVQDDRIRSRGMDAVDLPLAPTLAWLKDTDAVRFVVTAVARVGALTGPDLASLEAVAALGRPFIAAGGIASTQDLSAVREAGAEAAIVGRAAMEGGLDLPAAMALGEA